MSDEKWKEIERNLAEQESFVQTIMQQRQKRNRPENNANIDNILSSSIQQAKQKINTIQSSRTHSRNDRSVQNLSHSRQKREKHGEEKAGVAGAMKKLQEKIGELERQKKQLMSDLSTERDRILQTEQKYTQAIRSVEESKRKIKNLQLTIFNDKAWIKELDKKIQTLEKEAHNDKKKQQKQEELDSKLSNSQMMIKAQQQQFKNMILENQNKQKEIKILNDTIEEEKKIFNEESAMLKSLQKQLQLKIANMQERLKQKDNLIEGLRQEVKKSQIDKLKFSRALLDQSQKQHSISHHRESAFKSEILKEDLQDLRQKYEEMMQSYRNLEERGLKDKNDAKNYRNKFWQLKEIVKQIVEKIQSLPNAVTSQLRYLIIKANKIQAFSNDYYASTPTKSGKKSSQLNNSTSRSKSKSKSKMPLKFEDLNQSNNSARSNSKRSLKINRSDSVKKASSKSKEKKVIVSHKAIKSEEVSGLQNEIQCIRRKYKELVMGQGRSGEEVSEHMREELNNLAMLLQEKSEKLTKLKRNK